MTDMNIDGVATWLENWFSPTNHTHKNTVKTEITTGSLDTYTNTGWYSYSTSNSANITNVPVKVGSVMEVIDDYANGQYIVQKVYPIQSSKVAEVYVRVKYASSGWGAWEKMVTCGIVGGGKNLIKNIENSYKTSSIDIVTDGETFHNEPVYKALLSSVTDTSKYTDFTTTIYPNDFTYGDTFTLSFWAKGTSGKEIRAYFYGDSGYIKSKRIRSNSTVDYATGGSFGDGATRFNLTTDWQHYYVTYQLDSTGTATAKKRVSIRTFGGTDCSIACVQLERGEIATDYEPPKVIQRLNGGVDTACYVDLLLFDIWDSYMNEPINIDILYRGKWRKTQLYIQFSNTNLSASSSNVYTVSNFYTDLENVTFYLRKVADNKYMLCAYKSANTWFSIYNIENSNRAIRISIANNNYGTTAPSGSAPNLYSSTYKGTLDTDVTWTGGATSNSVSPLVMATDSEMGTNRLAYFPSNRMTVEYSTDEGSNWSTYPSIGTENKQRLTTLCRNTTVAYLGNNTNADYSKNQLRITFDVGDMNTDSILYMVTRKLAIYSATNNSTGLTCRIQTQTYAQYNTNTSTFSNYGSTFTLGGNAGWNTYPFNNVTLGGNSGTQTNSSSTRIKAFRLLFTQTGGTGNGRIERIRLYGETAWRTPSSLARNGHICYTDVNQNAVFPSKIIKDGGTANELLVANGDTTQLKTINNESLLGTGNISVGGGGNIPTKTSDLTNDGEDGTHPYLDQTDLLNFIYPVGSILISTSPVNPSLHFGGTWEQIKDTFLLACGDTYSANTTGGSADAVNVSHTHTTSYDYILTTGGSGVSRVSTAGQTGTKVQNLLQSNDAIYRGTLNSSGESGTGKNMPPYLAVYVWKRIQ